LPMGALLECGVDLQWVYTPFGRPINRAAGGCACQLRHPAAFVTKSAEDRLSSELAEPLDRPTFFN